MIVPMRQVTLFLSALHQNNAVKRLRELGIMHVKHLQVPQSNNIDNVKNEIANAQRALIQLENVQPEKNPKNKDGKEAVRNILEWLSEKESALSQLEELQETHAWFDRWGKVSLSDLQLLQESGVFIRCYRTDSTSLKRIPDTLNIQIIKEDKGSVFIVLFGKSPDEQLDLPEDKMPRVEIAELKKEISSLKKQLADLNKKWSKLTDTKSAIQTYLQMLEKDLEYHHVLAGLGDEESVVLLKGYCPEEAIDNLKKSADKNGWGYIIQEPENPTEVPTLLKNTKPLRIIEPLFQFMGTLPGYQEVDVSFVFLLFFSVFYAMIIGDAGYGLIFLAGTAFFRIKFRKAPFEPFALFFVLSITTIIWGALTGTWFGSRVLAELPFLKRFIIEPMFSFNNSKEATLFMMKFAFILGLIQLSLAHIMAFFKKMPSLKAIADLGWVLICVGMFFVVDLLVLSNPMPGFVFPVFIAGIVIVGLFTNFNKNPLKLFGNFLGTVANSIQDVISAFSDIVSYIRLFAVGLAGVTVAASFNDMASGIMAPLVLIIGHGLNIILGMMSVMVHGVRLNMLEFSGHLGQEWTGQPYEPFKE